MVIRTSQDLGIQLSTTSSVHSHGVRATRDARQVDARGARATQWEILQRYRRVTILSRPGHKNCQRAERVPPTHTCGRALRRLDVERTRWRFLHRPQSQRSSHVPPESCARATRATYCARRHAYPRLRYGVTWLEGQ